MIYEQMELICAYFYKLLLFLLCPLQARCYISCCPATHLITHCWWYSTESKNIPLYYQSSYTEGIIYDLHLSIYLFMTLSLRVWLYLFLHRYHLHTQIFFRGEVKIFIWFQGGYFTFWPPHVSILFVSILFCIDTICIDIIWQQPPIDTSYGAPAEGRRPVVSS